MNKEEYIKNLPGELAKEDINKIEDFFLSELSAGARAKPTGNIDNYVYFHEELGWGILKKQGKHGIDYQLIKLSAAKRFLGMKMGISIAMYIADVLTGDITKNAALSGIYGLSASEKELIAALKKFE